MAALALLMQHALALVLCALACRSLRQHLWGRCRQTTRSSRLRSYWQTIWWQWLAVGILLLTTPLADIVYLRGYKPPTLSVRALAFILTANSVALLYGPVALAWIIPRTRRVILAPFSSIRTLLPITLRERVLWLLLSLTTGVCEELLFRGFAINYLNREPLGLNLMLSALLPCVVFGVGHAYQGMAGMVRTTAFGAAMTAVFLLTGSIILPVFIHALVNARVAFLPTTAPMPALRKAAFPSAVPLQLTDA